MSKRSIEPTVQEFQPAMEELGLAKCPIRRRQVTVFLAKSKRPFLNCSICGARIFFNGRQSIRLLQKRMKPITELQDL
jgi:DNA-directed RNA polymerase subunit RPC12/RpoP